MLEIARRRQYREAAENIVRGMMSQLAAMTDGTCNSSTGMHLSQPILAEESQVRDRFNSEHGAHLPEDICLCIGNSPTRWEVLPWHGEELEVLPAVDPDLIAQVGNFLRCGLLSDPSSGQRAPRLRCRNREFMKLPTVTYLDCRAYE
jgi:autophagy-related protein 17